MENVNRKTVAATAILISACPALTSAQQITPSVPASPSSQSMDGTSVTPLVTTFSCGSIWTEASQCTQLCSSGSGCPNGQQCYAGIPCPQEMVERQRQEELFIMESLVEEREREFMSRFVCGRSYDDAVESCSGGDSSNSSEGVSWAAHAYFCTSGLSSECPSGMQCYASVSCPRSKDEATADDSATRSDSVEPSTLIIHSRDMDILHNLSSFVTEPILLNYTNNIGSTMGYYNDVVASSETLRSTALVSMLLHNSCYH